MDAEGEGACSLQAAHRQGEAALGCCVWVDPGPGISSSRSRVAMVGGASTAVLGVSAASASSAQRAQSQGWRQQSGYGTTAAAAIGSIAGMESLEAVEPVYTAI